MSDNNNNQVVGNVVTNPSGRLKVTGLSLLMQQEMSYN